ncbi:SprT-like family-domain-containing protein [Gaertneriomyces semiglobifer]|nr:SprT-like family-domain-containing protein [Gaertneriomyces semiglobifer]
MLKQQSPSDFLRSAFPDFPEDGSHRATFFETILSQLEDEIATREASSHPFEDPYLFLEPTYFSVEPDQLQNDSERNEVAGGLSDQDVNDTEDDNLTSESEIEYSEEDLSHRHKRGRAENTGQSGAFEIVQNRPFMRPALPNVQVDSITDDTIAVDEGDKSSAFIREEWLMSREDSSGNVSDELVTKVFSGSDGQGSDADGSSENASEYFSYSEDGKGTPGQVEGAPSGVLGDAELDGLGHALRSMMIPSTQRSMRDMNNLPNDGRSSVFGSPPDAMENELDSWNSKSNAGDAVSPPKELFISETETDSIHKWRKLATRDVNAGHADSLAVDEWEGMETLIPKSVNPFKTSPALVRTMESPFVTTRRKLRKYRTARNISPASPTRNRHPKPLHATSQVSSIPSFDHSSFPSENRLGATNLHSIQQHKRDSSQFNFTTAAGNDPGDGQNIDISFALAENTLGGISPIKSTQYMWPDDEEESLPSPTAIDTRMENIEEISSVSRGFPGQPRSSLSHLRNLSVSAFPDAREKVCRADALSGELVQSDLTRPAANTLTQLSEPSKGGRRATLTREWSDSDDDDAGILVFDNTPRKPQPLTPWQMRLGAGVPQSTPVKKLVRRPLTSVQNTPQNALTPTAFKRRREAMSRELYKEFNRTIFQSMLPDDMPITWSKTLNKTAGRTIMRRSHGQHYSAVVELSSKILDDISKLRNTLVHELCHAAAWLIDHVDKPPHGATFKKWSAAAEAAYNDIKVTTCHSYEIAYKYTYQCTNDVCRYTYGRHSKSIDVQKMGCGHCRCPLELLESTKLKKDGTPFKVNPYSAFVKENYSRVKVENPRMDQRQLMAHIGKLFRTHLSQEQEAS